MNVTVSGLQTSGASTGKPADTIELSYDKAEARYPSSSSTATWDLEKSG